MLDAVFLDLSDDELKSDASEDDCTCCCEYRVKSCSGCDCYYLEYQCHDNKDFCDYSCHMFILLNVLFSLFVFVFVLCLVCFVDCMLPNCLSQNCHTPILENLKICGAVTVL